MFSLADFKASGAASRTYTKADQSLKLYPDPLSEKSYSQMSLIVLFSQFDLKINLKPHH